MSERLRNVLNWIAFLSLCFWAILIGFSLLNDIFTYVDWDSWDGKKIFNLLLLFGYQVPVSYIFWQILQYIVWSGFKFIPWKKY
jgi:hypothetical protein